jgi:tripartite-type tricarboxylate transporter receptor subunit TctC
MLTRRLLLALAAAVALARGAETAVAAADSYPSRVISLIVPYAAGGPSDTVGRILAESMSRTLGQQVIVENLGGASGTIGAARVAKANPDGYTLLLHTPAQATNDLLYRKLAYGSRAAFEPIGIATDTPMTLVGRADLPPNSIGELLDYIRTNRDKVTYGNAGIGGPSHLCGMLIMSMLATQMTTVPYKGTGPAMIDILGGQIDLICDQATNTIGHIKAGKVKPYAVTTMSRVSVLPDVPTLDEGGLKGFETTVWLGLYAPKGTPKEVIDKLSAALRTALQDPNVIERLAQVATKPASLDRANPQALKTALEAEIAKWQPLIQAAGDYAE